MAPPPSGLLGRVSRKLLRAAGGAVYYAIYRRFPRDDDPDPYWRQMHPDQDKGTGARGLDFEPPSSL